MSVYSSTAKKLYGLSAGRCNICKKKLHDRNLHSGEMAHIVAENLGGPRSDVNYSGDINGYENLILLCVYHHTMIDQDEDTYTITVLKSIKNDHENKVDIYLSNEQERVSDVSSLNVLMKYMPFVHLPNDVNDLPYRFNIRMLEIGQAVEGFLLCNPHSYPFYDTALTKKFEAFYSRYQEVVGALNWRCRDAMIFDSAVGGYCRIKSEIFSQSEFEAVCAEISKLTRFMVAHFYDLVSYLRQSYRDVMINSYMPNIIF